MTLALAALVGLLFAAGAYLVLQHDAVRLALGFVLLSNAVNLLVFAAGRPDGAPPPLVPAGRDAVTQAVADPVTQALVLTALVIGSGVVTWLLALVRDPSAKTDPGAPVSPDPGGAERASDPLPHNP